MKGKKNFEEPMLNVMEFSVEDIMTASSTLEDDVGQGELEE